MKEALKIKRFGCVWKDSNGVTFLFDGTSFQNVLTGELYDVIVERLSEDCLLISN